MVRVGRCPGLPAVPRIGSSDRASLLEDCKIHDDTGICVHIKCIFYRRICKLLLLNRKLPIGSLLACLM